MKLHLNAPVTLLFFALATAATVLQGVSGINSVLMVYGPPRLSLNFAFRVLASSFAHKDMNHLIGNFTFLLLLGPALEEKYGHWKVAGMFLLTAIIIGILHSALFSGGLVGASGIVFMCVMLMSFSAARAGTVPLSFVLIALLFLGREVMDSLRPDGISQFAHLAGGAVGIIFGFSCRPAQADGEFRIS